MAPPFKHKRQASYTSTSARTLQSRRSERGRFKRPSIPSQPSSQREQDDPTHSQAASRRHASPSSVPPQAQPYPVSDNDEVNEDLEQVIMAVDRQQKGTIGCAYYVAREEKLYCLQDVTDGTLDAIETLKLDIRPTTVLLSSRVDPEDNQWEAARRLRRGSLVGDVGEEPPLPYQVDIRPSQEFSYEGAKTKLINLESTIARNDNTTFLVPGDPSTYEDERDHENFGSTNRQGKLLRLSSWIDFENRVGVGCMGAVLTHLQRRRAVNYLPDDPDAQWAFRVRNLDMLTLKNTMFISPDTLLSLQIIQPESHPNAFNQGPGSKGSKESLSIYGLFHHHARTPQGKVKLRQTFLRPSLQLEVINARLDFVSVFVRPDNLIPLQKLSKSMSRIKNIRTIMTHLHKGINGGNQKFGGFKSGVWATLLEFTYHTIDIRDSLCEVVGGENLLLLAKAMEVLDTRSLQHVGKHIHDIVDLDSSIDQNRTVVKRGVSDELDDIKNRYDGMGDLLSRTAVAIARTLPNHVDVDLNVIYIPQLGYHITMPLDPNTRQPVYEGDPDDPAGGGRWERMFTTENQVYLKDTRMREMDERLGDLWNMICDLEIEISYHLAQRVLQHEELLISVSDLCGELDCMFALAHGAIQHKLVRPRMTEENVIEIKSCRHLLQEMTVPSYVANDAYLVGGSGADDDNDNNNNNNNNEEERPARTRSSTISPSLTPRVQEGQVPPSTLLLLTGPNYSGKSIYLKSIALLTYLSHLGSFVPCASARIGLTDAILTRIRTCETVSRPHSSFMIDLQQVAGILGRLTRRSLVLVDEFGRGTGEGDGVGLLVGVLGCLLGGWGGERRREAGRWAEAPKVVAATHFYEILELGALGGLEVGRRGLGFAHLEVRVDRRGNHHHLPTSGSGSGSGSGRRRRRRTADADADADADAADPYAENGSDQTEVTYLYNLLPGPSCESFGTQCAAMNGVPGPVVQRASLLSRLVAEGQDLVRVCAGVGREEEEGLERAEEVARRFLEWHVDAEVEGDGDVRTILDDLVGEKGGVWSEE